MSGKGPLTAWFIDGFPLAVTLHDGKEKEALWVLIERL